MLRMLGVIRSPITTFTFVANNARTSSSAPLQNWSNDSEIRRRQNDRRNERRRIRSHTDPVYKENLLIWHKANHDAHIKQMRSCAQARRASDPAYVLRDRVHHLVQYAWARKDLPWKTHQMWQMLGVKVWWREKQYQGEDNGKQDLEDQGQAGEAGDDGNKYLCHSCYFTGPEAMPEGYEDLLKITDIKKRKKQLGH
ncbi:hypothetical protein E4T43_00234 [Aureobasidium subglaciale]|nr:hypothetical protein E4T43_00234 [Aureobasidium subglaciale]